MGTNERGLNLRKAIGESDINVVQGEITGHNVYKRPNFQERSRKSFQSGEEALAWIKENPNLLHSVDIALPFSLEADLSGEFRMTPQRITITVNGRTGSPKPRTQEGGYGISASPTTNEVHTINIHVGDRDADPVFERGLAWLHPYGNNRPARLSFTVQKGVSEEQLHSAFERLASQAQQVLDYLLS